MTVTFLTGLSYPAFMLANFQGILMSLEMTDLDFSYVSCFVSCFDNTGYRIMCPPYICHRQPKLKKIGDLGRDTG